MWIEFVSDTTTGLNLKWEVTETCHYIVRVVLINTFKNIVFPSSVTNEYSILSSCQKVEEVCDSKYVLHFSSNLKLNQFNPDDLQ